jgi:hypothetical protein
MKVVSECAQAHGSRVLSPNNPKRVYVVSGRARKCMDHGCLAQTIQSVCTRRVQTQHTGKGHFVFNKTIGAYLGCLACTRRASSGYLQAGESFMSTSFSASLSLSSIRALCAA